MSDHQEAPKRAARWRALISDSDGAALPETTILLSVIVTCLVVGVCCLGHLCRTSLFTTSSAMSNVDWIQESQVAATVAGEGQSAGAPALAGSVAGLPMWGVLVTTTLLAVAGGTPVVYILSTLSFGTRSAQDMQVTPGPVQPPAEASETAAEKHAFAKRQQLKRVFENNMASLLDGRLKVRQIMSRQLTCAKPDASVESVREVMQLKKIQHVMITDNQDALIGTVSDEMLAGTQEQVIHDVMTREPFSLDADLDLSPALTTLIRQRVHCIPVTSKGRLVGIVTLLDLLVAFQCALHSLANVVKYFPEMTDASPADQPRDEAVAGQA